jgi:hypothetical protein
MCKGWERDPEVEPEGPEEDCLDYEPSKERKVFLRAADGTFAAPEK